MIGPGAAGVRAGGVRAGDGPRVGPSVPATGRRACGWAGGDVKALVTGASGFLGLHLVEMLRERGDEVRALARRPHPAFDALGVDVVQADVRDAAAVASACADRDVVFHTAAIAGIWGRWPDYHETNVVGTRNVIAGCRTHAVTRLVHTSSPSVTFDGRPQESIDESAGYARRWLAHYPHSKALAEKEVLGANTRDGLRTCALRPHLIWGPRDGHLVPRLIDRARKGSLMQVGSGTNRIDITYVENAAWAHIQAAESLGKNGGPAGKAYFVSQGEPIVCWEWIGELLSLARLPYPRRHISYPTAYRVGALFELAYTVMRRSDEPRMTRFLAGQLALSHYFDLSAARRDFGYAPVVSIEEGMRRMAGILR